MSIINKIMSKQNNAFILFKKDIEQDNDKEILGVYSSHDIASSEKQKYSIKYTIDKLNIEGPFIINKNVLSPPGPPPPIYPDPLYAKPNLNKPSLPRFNPIYPNMTKMLMGYNSIF